MRKQLLTIAIILTFFCVGSVRETFALEEGKDKNIAVLSENKNTVNKDDTGKNTKDSNPISLEENIILLNEKVKKLEKLIEKQQQVIELLQTKASEANTLQVTSTFASETNASSNLGENKDSLIVNIPKSVLPGVKVAQSQGLTEDQQKKLEKIDSLARAFGSFSLSGDLRFRYDGQFNQGFDAPIAQPNRNQIRFRVSLGLSGKFNENLDWGIQVTSGELTNPTSNNQTATDFFNRKAVGFNRYFLRYDSKPKEGLGVILQAGKFDFPWRRTELTFDNDLQPEGSAETIYYKSNGFVKDVRFVAFQLPFFENSGGKDGDVFGGQIQGTFTKGKWSFIPSITYLNFNQTDYIARSLNRPITQIGGGLAVSTTNRVRRDANGNIIGFASNFNILDIIGEVRYLGNSRYPVSVLFNYARNMSSRLDTLKERNAYWTECKIGQVKEKGDIEITYLFSRVQQDAVLSVFSCSDTLATNSITNRVTMAYTLSKSVFFRGSIFFIERFDVPRNVENRTARRLFLEANYRF